ncbi:hypothetical protein [Paenibacillus sp. J2TS4]|nr:hypothetical protein [Paenibacillus sp. J2TS4]GIP35107.1 hypothetical protein J2TS4_43170 [Paenibacillus sp. J2TS4]
MKEEDKHDEGREESVSDVSISKGMVAGFMIGCLLWGLLGIGLWMWLK